MAAAVAVVPFLIEVLDVGVVALVEAAVVVVLLTVSAKFVSNMGILQMFVISGPMLAFNHMSPSLFLILLRCSPFLIQLVLLEPPTLGLIPILSQQAQVIISPMPCSQTQPLMVLLQLAPLGYQILELVFMLLVILRTLSSSPILMAQIRSL